MKWHDVEHEVRARVVPGVGILKCDGTERRPVVSNSRDRIGMRTGVTTKSTKTITYTMLQYAYQTLQLKGRFDSGDFRAAFDAEYVAAPCRYSMTGGVLVAVGVAIVVPTDGDSRCSYISSKATSI